ncbi:MAG: hydroxymethylglutaryl-CoA reductase, degradative [Anaerolineales bacterium]|nr:hydroxymethylglutaryl-CoA reductase, degradative [Anaerolineales bacterium]
MRTSRLPGFYQKTLAERAQMIAAWAALTPAEQAALDGSGGLTPQQADHLIENVVGVYALPLGIAANFVVNGREVLVPMAVEEPSVVASASFMAKLARAGGGFTACTTEPEMIGQLQILEIRDRREAQEALAAHKQRLLDLANAVHPSMVRRGGGARDLEVREIHKSPIGPFLVLHIIYDTRDAMGANLINTVCEALAPEVEALTGGRVHLRILSNLSDRRLARARCVIPADALAFGSYSGERVRDGILEAYAFAAADPYRAATHNKGIMNGIDPVVIATGNDWRAIEAGAHAYAARSGRYTSLSTWEVDEEGNLVGTLELPLAVGIVGGATRAHPTAQAALKVLGVASARELAEIIASVGLAQNLGALRALATEGIQRGHMSLHARQVAVAAGATGDRVAVVAARLVAEGVIRVERAREILREISTSA